MKNTVPPRWADRLLESFCPSSLLEEVQGDLHELYSIWAEEQGLGKARWLYVFHALKFFKPFVLRKNQHYSLNNTPMFKNYFKVGIRNILRYKVFSFINVFGLAVAMSVCMLIILMLADQKSYDQFHAKKDRIYRILSNPKDAKSVSATTPVPLAASLKSDYPIIETSTHLIQGLRGEAIHDQKMAEIKGYFADSSFFQIFSFGLEKGNPATALNAPNAMVISQEMAEQLFRTQDPIGKTVEFIDQGETTPVSWGLFTVSGVMASEYKTHLEFDVLVSASSLPLLYAEEKIADLTNNWSSYSSAYTYALLYPEHSQEDLEALLAPLAEQKIASLEEQKGFRLNAQALTSITPGPILNNESRMSLPLMAYYILGGLALIIMLSACLNYTNLSIARALTRAKEIGVRKVTGARKTDLMYQFLSESILMTLLALAFAILLLVVLKPAFMSLWVNQYLHFDLQENFSVYLIFLGFALLIGLFAGIYPALHLSGFRPAKVLKNLESMQAGKLGMRKVLSSFQLIISMFFIVTSLLIYKQFKHYLAFDYGFTSEQVVNVPLQGNPYELVVNELSSVAGVASISASEYIPATGYNNGAELRKVNSEEDYTHFISLPVNEDFITNLDIELVAGSNLPETATGSDHLILVNESAVKALGYEYPAEIVGVVFDSKWGEKDLEVIGVVKDFRIDLPMFNDRTRPTLMQNLPNAFRYANIKIASGNLVATLDQLEETWKKIDPVHPFEYEFYNQQLASTHQGILDVVSIIGFIAFLAITIACLGMLGMATYTVERRIKEVGIRKVLGAENLNIALLLSRSFMITLLISIGIAAPLSYFLNNFLLQFFANRVEFGFGIIFTGSLILLVLGGITIGSQTFRAARQNPVDTLRSE
ncbi:ABC transporter permease [Catalinimonas niigatensis]|uniref:ABC transporter permease n=1 Tax=Catalinimonas niigatensis TaxID=1397264 RepID=UPI0026660D2F|nr:ABC transporter permease [Catalinimonas niigatensis]WPP52702.1 permease prefix domain 2-containing transporter [Catalinimonas niigatensis]